METPNETWQVDVDGALYEADTETLRQWALDGYVTPQTKVQKGTLKWIELGRVPAFRGLFSGADRYAQSASPAPAYGFAPPGAAADPYGAPAAAPAAGGCVNHPAAPAKYMCLSCGALLCTPCVKRYGNAAVCTLCGQLSRPINEARAEIKQTVERASGFRLRDLALAIQYPLKDPVALAIAAIVYGFLSLFGWYGKAAAAGILFGYMSHAIRRVSMGHYDEGPSPDLSDPGDLIFEAGKLGIAVSLITYGPLVAVILFGIASFDGFEGFDVTTLASLGLGIILAGLWAAFYYPMALLVAGYTGEFFATINPIVGIATMGRLGFDYIKAYFLCLCVYGLQLLLSASLGVIGRASEAVGNTLAQAAAYLVQYIVQGAVAFFASMVIAALLGLVLYKRPDVVDVEV